VTQADTVELAALLAAARRDVEETDLPACQLAVARDGELIAFETFGDATNATRFCAFSATKPIVSSAVWLLMGDGLLDITRPVGEYVPEFEANGKEAVTVEQVLLHTAGFPSPQLRPEVGADPAQRLEAIAAWPLEWQPGTRFAYHASSAHWVLAELLERLTGADFRDVVEQRVCTPLGLPRVLGIAPDHQDGIAELVFIGDGGPADNPPGSIEFTEAMNRPRARAAGVPGGGGFMTAADLALFYQGLLHNPDDLWRPDVLADGTGDVRNTFPDEIFSVPVNRTIGVVVAGDDGNHIVRQAGFGAGCSPRAFGHAGMHMQIGWADPESGISFAYLSNGCDSDMFRAGARGVALSSMAASLRP
jgi:CubicO group peptidase (beta-lactamase class C family)